ncbi:MAG: NAD(P)H-dependent oxidoreductase [Verrucomicrobiota bacterium]
MNTERSQGLDEGKMKKKPVLLGVAASLRNARWGAGSQKLLDSLADIEDEESLFSYLERESELHLENFVNAGRKDGKDFLEIYDALKKSKGDRGLSNSEIALAAALWAARNCGVEIDHLSLSEFFLPSGKVKNADLLRAKLLRADGLLLSGPVYFGDRGSLAQTFQNLICQDEEIRSHFQGKPYAGLAVGAKRNGGQETCLIYQMWDMINAGLLGLGNDSETTAQYGGTGHAGDVGTMHRDTYGLNTSMGAGRRIGSVLSLLSHEERVSDRLRVAFLILQDHEDRAYEWVSSVSEDCGESMRACIYALSDKRIMRCLACDICPTHIDVDEEYRCIIKSTNDYMGDIHRDLLYNDILIPVVMSRNDGAEVESNYQQFIERTRYLRRGDYVFSNNVVAPMVLEELGSRENMPMRIMTSMIRHHTIMTRPIVGHLHEGEILNGRQVASEFREMLEASRSIAGGRLAEVRSGLAETKYNPVGYILSADKNAEDEKRNERRVMMADRMQKYEREAEKRLAPDRVIERT